MQTQDVASIIYFFLLILVIGGWFFAQQRQSMNKTLQQVVLWVFLFAGVILLYSVKDQLRLQIMPKQAVQIGSNKIAISRSADRHFYTTLKINNMPVQFVIDTGATDMVLSKKDAVRVGIDLANLAYLNVAQTANGKVRTARVTLDEVVLGPFVDRNISAWVNDSQMGESLLGMSYLSRFSNLQISGDTLYLSR
ncbi:MAG: TIGR02281 family clan AA aspartic protease [Alphaproteobacteria bacterium]|nr:TIGR02281 family clan AA aspartic protease [Alphaproteobacteria bacterium]